MSTSLEKFVQHEVAMCRKPGGEGLLYWAQKYAYVLDKSKKQWVLFDPYPYQRSLLTELASGKWLIILKARQVGATTTMTIYESWLYTFFRETTCANMNQNEMYAMDFLDKIREILKRLPKWQINDEHPDDVDNLGEISSVASGCCIRALASTARSARSMTGDVCFFDEAAYHDKLKESVRAAEPILNDCGGQAIMASTSQGADNDFAEFFRAAPQNKYYPIFYSWRAHPRRSDEWYERERLAHKSDPLYMPREYPNTPEEAFTYATGRIYPMYSDSLVMELPEMVRMAYTTPWRVQLYRFIDFGTSGSHYFVCLWVAHDCTAAPKLTQDPSCVNFKFEMQNYRYDEDGKIEDRNNHGPDAIRIGVTTKQLSGHVHVYREMYEKDSYARGLTVLDHATRIHKLSGWRPLSPSVWERGDMGEPFAGGVADRNGREQMMHMARHGLSMTPAIDVRTRKFETIGRPGRTEVEQGVETVNMLIIGGSSIRKVLPGMESHEEYQRFLKARPTWSKTMGDKLSAEALERDMEYDNLSEPKRSFIRIVGSR